MTPMEPTDALENVMRSWLLHRGGNDGELLAACATALHAARAAGKSCLNLRELSKATGMAEKSLVTRLQGTSLCSDGSIPAAFVMDGTGRLFFHRTWQAEQAIAKRLALKINNTIEVDPRVAGSLIRDEFGQAGHAVNWQALAVAAAIRNRFTVITGGPGTGKTYTVAKLIVVLRKLQPDLTFALAAPTGKAARRMRESLADSLGDNLPESMTLHSLLGFQSGGATFARNERDPVPHDLVVVDEASMADIELMNALLRAIRPEARLVVVGDRDQLPSVDLGQFLADLCTLAKPELGLGPGLAAWSKAAGLMFTDREDASEVHPLADTVVALRETRRFGPNSGLGRAARAIAERKTLESMQVLEGGFPDLRRVDPDALGGELTRLKPTFEACTKAPSEQEALEAHARIRILCLHNVGPDSVADLNQRVEKMLGVRDPWYQGRPILVTRNDPELGLSNGDLGVCWPSPGGTRVFFLTGSGGVRSVLTAQLPEHCTAWAMTVHKAQGSEADEVLLVLPHGVEGQLAALLQAPLVYTGLTRAKSRATVVAEKETLAHALSTWPDRASGMVDALRTALQPSRSR